MIFNVEMETMPHDQMRELQLQRLKETLQHAYQQVLFYREAMDQAGIHPKDIMSVDDIAKLPFLQKKDLRDHYPFGLFAVERSKVARIHGSSGTKGKPTIVGYTKEDLDNWAEIVARAICCAGGKPGDLFHNAYGYGLFTGGLGLHNGVEHLGATVVPVSGGNTSRQITLIQDFAPRGIASTPSYLLNIIETMRKEGIDPSKTSLEYGVLGAEPWSEEMRQQIEEGLGIKAVDIYGLSEVMGPGVSIECAEAQDGLHIAEDHFIAEVVDRHTGKVLPYGEIGELVFTSLTKKAFPVIRYRTGDIASLHSETCCCGRTTLRMSRIKGRVDDMLIIRGVNVFPTEIESTLLQFTELSPHYQVEIMREGSLDRFEVHVEVTRSFMEQVPNWETSDTLALLKSAICLQMKENLGVSIHLQIHAADVLPRSEGKAIRVVDKRNSVQV
ncbi:phenylacetate--CoA ligase family protein [Risungbinella massiliensis]|uniref:phenylacetate--CoA ligase family protein n=1 Tax=Risungbinella massiliensis TaxID=1329796 RepID=UPI0005CBDCDF|nr:phenylacetate--CoA ligase [Risungbinella massiliensis]